VNGCPNTVDLRLGYRKRPYIATMELHMMAVLMPFNSADCLTLSDVREVTQLPDRDLMKQLQLLVDGKILLAQVLLTYCAVFLRSDLIACTGFLLRKLRIEFLKISGKDRIGTDTF